MPCGKNEVTLAPSEIKLFLNAVNEQSLTAEDIVKKTKKPMFKVRSSLRELVEASYIEEKDAKFSILDKGKQYIQ